MENEKVFGGVFIGRELGKQSEPGVEKQWIQYKLKFQPKEGKQFGFQISMFDPQNNPQSLSISQLVESKYYKVIYCDGKINLQSGKPFKRFISINEAVAGSVVDTLPQAQPTQQPAPNAPNNIVSNTNHIEMSNWEAFKPQYFAGCVKHNIKPNICHMVGSYVRAYDKSYIERLLNLADVEIKAQERPKQPETAVVDVV